MKIGRYALVGAGVAIGYVFGSRAGRQRYEQLTHWLRSTSEDLGVPTAVDRVVDSAHEAAVDLRATATDRAHEAIQAGSQTVSDGVRSAGEAIKPDA